MECDSDSSPVGMSIMLMAATLPSELETIPKECVHKFTGGYGPKSAPVDIQIRQIRLSEVQER